MKCIISSSSSTAVRFLDSLNEICAYLISVSCEEHNILLKTANVKQRVDNKEIDIRWQEKLYLAKSEAISSCDSLLSCMIIPHLKF